MINYKQKLEDFQQTFDTYLELGVSDYDFEVEAYEDFVGEFEQYFTGEEDLLRIEVDALILIAGEHFDSVSAQEELDQELDERKYESTRHLS